MYRKQVFRKKPDTENVISGVFIEYLDSASHAKTLIPIRTCLYTMDKIPSEETGTFSIHNGPKDRERIQRLGEHYEKKGPSPVWTRALEDAEKLKDMKNTYQRFLEDEIGMGGLMRKLNQL